MRLNNNFPAEKQATSITLSDGRTFRVCTKNQYKALIKMAERRMLAESEDVPEELFDVDNVDFSVYEAVEAVAKVFQEIKRLSDKPDELCRYVEPVTGMKGNFATLEWILSQMTPQEREQWKVQYRFCGINKRM